MKITHKMYLLAKEIVEEYEKENAIELKKIEVMDPEFVKPKKEKEFSYEVTNCVNSCLSFFPEHLHPDSPRKWDKVHDTIDKLNRLDKIPFDRIVQIVQWARSDKFWSKNFLSLNKLRNTDKNGTKYVVIFNEKIRSMETQGKAQSNYNAIQQALKDLGNE